MIQPLWKSASIALYMSEKSCWSQAHMMEEGIKGKRLLYWTGQIRKKKANLRKKEKLTKKKKKKEGKEKWNVKVAQQINKANKQTKKYKNSKEKKRKEWKNNIKQKD